MAVIKDSFRWVPFLAAILCVFVAVLLPAEWINGLRHRWWWFTYPLDRIESVRSAVNLIHAILFLLLGWAAHLALPRWRLGGVAMAFLFLGGATELAQLVVPGRHSRLSDVLVDVVAGVLGWAAMRCLARLRWGQAWERGAARVPGNRDQA